MSECSIILTTYPDKASARKIAKLLVEKRLAACVQLFPIESVYSWKNEICEEKETMLFIKSRTELFGEISAAIKENHYHKVPEIVRVPIADGLPDYLKWIGECVES
ncbi:MAG: divalent-cation tolerance protein CutA [Oscillospiraceae bacterium]|jgi:periplasmic divalent cation tolerance protein|nr:divalent-cation tolerance protein CutA [Oscillospiraceae bacterium]